MALPDFFKSGPAEEGQFDALMGALQDDGLLDDAETFGATEAGAADGAALPDFFARGPAT